ncbi:MAG: flippase [Lactobacillus amylovorus]|jgi:O-antigen/teichoic acid export membrane protein|nr:flippase [Lactobacillus amylovorus]
MRKKSLGINAFLNGIRSVINVLFPLISFPYVSRVLSVDGIGIYNFSNTYVNYFVLIAGLGISTYAVREGAKYRDNAQKINVFSSQIFTINIISTLVAYFLLFLTLFIFKNLSKYIVSILIFSLQILFTTIGTEWIYVIYEDFSYITIRSIVFKILSLVLLFLCVKNANDYLIYVGITVLANVGSNFLNFIHAKKLCEIRIIKNTNWKKHLIPILIIFASSIATSIYVSSDTTILGLLKGNYAVGIYSVSIKIYTIAESLLGAIVVVMVPRLSLLIGQHKMKSFKSLLSDVIDDLLILVIPAATGLFLLSEDIILIIAGKKYVDSNNSLRIVCWTIILSVFNLIFSQCILIPAKKEGKVLKNTIITAFVNVLLNLILIPKFSYDGSAISTVISEFLVMVLNCWDARSVTKSILFSKYNLKNLIDSIIGSIGIILIYKVFLININSTWQRLILTIIVSIVVYFLILLILKNNRIKNILKSFTIS